VNDDNDDDGDDQTRTNIHALSGIRSHGLSIQAMKTYASDSVATGTGCKLFCKLLDIVKVVK
jgi:hypothetical protein